MVGVSLGGIDRAMRKVIALGSVVPPISAPRTGRWLVSVASITAFSGACCYVPPMSGRTATLVPALVICACALPAFQHFKPGRIDHHNVQIAFALAVIAAAAWSDRARHAAALAGALTGLAAAVGLEGLLFLVTGGAALALRFAFGGNRAASTSGTIR